MRGERSDEQEDSVTKGTRFSRPSSNYYLFIEGKPEFSLGVLKITCNSGPGSSKRVYGHYKEKLTTKPNPQARIVKSMLYLLSRTGLQLATTNPTGLSKRVSSTSSKKADLSKPCITSAT